MKDNNEWEKRGAKDFSPASLLQIPNQAPRPWIQLRTLVVTEHVGGAATDIESQFAEGGLRKDVQSEWIDIHVATQHLFVAVDFGPRTDLETPFGFEAGLKHQA